LASLLQEWNFSRHENEATFGAALLDKPAVAHGAGKSF
jgi:hypothetical protein